MMENSGACCDESSVTLLKFTFDIGNFEAGKHYWTKKSQDGKARQGEHDKQGK
jgi:hypothetical protein